MEFNYCIVYWGCLIVPLFNNFINVYLGNPHDGYFSDEIIEKLTIPHSSYLRKIMIFKENKSALHPFLYIRAIPYLIQLCFVVINIPIFLIDQLIFSFLPDIFFMALSGILFVAHYVYQLVLVLLSRIYTKKGL